MGVVVDGALSLHGPAMTPEVGVGSMVWTRYGKAAHMELCSVLADIKRDDALRRVTVLVPTQLCGVIVLRRLAHGVGGRSGVAGLSVLTVDRLAEQLATPSLAGRGRRPATDPVLAAAWRRALVEAPGVFGPVGVHPATVRALVAAHRELREVDDAGLDAIAGTGESIATDLVRLHRKVVGLLSDGWYDVTDLRLAAIHALRDRPQLGQEIGAVVVFLPQDLPVGAAALLAELSKAGDVRVIAALGGARGADAGVLASLGRLHHGLPEAPLVEEALAARIVHASDADDEVRCVVRMLCAALRSAPAHRVAVLYGAVQPYARLLAEHLAEAGIGWSGPGVRPTVARTLPRALLDLFGLPDHGWRRDEVLAVLSAAPLHTPDGQGVPASRWERISRIAGVVAGEDWDIRLNHYAAGQRGAADREKASEAPRAGLIARYERDAAAAEALCEFVAGLRSRLHRGACLRTWPELSGWALEMFGALVADLDGGTWLPEAEARAAEKIERTLSGLAGLGAVEATADLTALRLALDLELADDLPRHGRFGEGVLVGPLSAAVGLDVDAVFVVGLAEDLVPGQIGADAVLPDRVRCVTGGQLASLRERVDRTHRHLLAALAAAPDPVVSFPRGDLRRSSSQLPSRWLLPSLRALSGGEALPATGWHTTPGLLGSPSYAASLAATDELATGQEWRLRAVTAARSRGGSVVEALPADVVLTRAVAMLRARSSVALTRFDGDLSGLDVPDPTSGPAVSPTALEAWARCPHAYFVGRMLWVEPVQSPEERLQIGHLELGNLFHTVLDVFFTQQSRAGAIPGGAEPWTPEQRAQLAGIARQVGADLVTRGATGHPLLWRQELGRVLSDLDLLLDDDETLRAHTGRRQERSELDFGHHSVAPVEVRLPEGRVIRLRGSADRVDRAGDTITVVDYKTGHAQPYAGLSEADPTGGGLKLQLPVYAYAARAALGTPHAPVVAEYWFLRRDRGKRVTLPLSPQVERAYAEALAVITDAIASGLFPHRPPTQDSWGGDFIECPYCDPDGLGVAEHRHRWSHTRQDPRLAAYLRLVDPDAAAQVQAQAQP